MATKILIDIPSMNWAYTVLLESGNEYSFGTARENTFPLPPGTAAAQHALLTSKDNKWILEDRESGQGIQVNGESVTKAALRHLDVIRIGACEAVFQSPEHAADQAERDHTHRIAEEQKTALQSVVAKAEAGEIQTGELERAVTQRTMTSGLTPQGFNPSLGIPPLRSSGKEKASLSTQDMVWVAQKLAAIMSAVLLQPIGREEAFRLMLQHLRDAITADNGFIMIPNQINSRWHIRAWVGDSSSWTQYEKDHPLPLTVTNRAYRTNAIVSNALLGATDEPINSFSLQQLGVSSYIAVPLLQSNERRGVLYFDTRKQGRKFGPRDIKLLELAGTCILEIEDLPQ